MKTSPKDAQQAAEALEAYFLRRVLSEVKTTGGMATGIGGDTFNDMFNEAIADTMAGAGGVGMSKQILQQLEAGAGMAPRSAAPGSIEGGGIGGGKALPGGAGLSSSSSLHMAMAQPTNDAGLPLAPTARPLAMPRGMAVYKQAAEAAAPVPTGTLADLTVRPVPGRITSRMGDRFDPIDGHHSHHAGIDLAAKTGTPVHSAGPGKVVRAGAASGYGNLVVVDHGNGLETRYAHLDRIDVEVGDSLGAGQQVGAAGATGRVTGAHLHFEVRQDGEPVDPAALIRGAKPVTTASERPPSDGQVSGITGQHSALKSAR